MASLTGKKFGKMAVIAPAAFINSMAIGTMSLGILFVVKDLYGASPALVGSLGAMWSMAYFIGCIVLRRAATRLKPRTAMLVMLIGSAAILSTFLAFPGLWQAFVAYAAYGFITAFFWPPVMGWLSTGYEGAELNKATSLFSFSWSVGGIFSSYVAGLLSERGKFLPILTSVILFAINAVFVIASKSFVPDDEVVKPEPGDAPAVDRSTPLRFPAWLGAFLIYAVLGVVFNVFPVFARDKLGQSESTVGLILTSRAMATAVGFYVMGRISAWHFKRGLVPAASALTALVLALLVVQKSVLGFSLCFVAIGALQAMIYNSSLFYATSGAPDRNKRASVHEALLTFGQVIGSVGGGLLYQSFSMPVVFIGLVGLLIAGTAVQAIMVSNGQGRRRERLA